MYLSRRHFLSCAATAALNVPAAFASVTEQRTLKFIHTHTGETLQTCYAVGGRYLPQCLQQVNHFLRDFRTGESHRIDPTLLDLLYDLQVAADRDDTFEVISAYRSPDTNTLLRRKSTGVAKQSLHKEGRAIDVRLTDFSTKKLRDTAMSLQRGGVGYYAGSNFVHVDTGRVRFW